MTFNLHLAQTIITNEKEPVFNGAILVENSKIKSIGKKEDFGSLNSFQGQVIDHGDSLMCPGFINLHAHLLYSNIKNIDGSNGLFPWLEKLVDKTSTLSDKDYTDSINFGIENTLSTGTTYIIENTPNLLSAKLLSENSLKATIGFEIFGSDENVADETFKNNLDKLTNLKVQYKNLDFTFSPHAPYDVSIPLWKKLVNWSHENKKPLLTHLEESPQEKMWWANKSGPATNFWRKINKFESKLKHCKFYDSGTDFLKKNNLLSNQFIATHLCQTTKEDLISLKEKNIKLVHCPRSNFYLNNGTANLKMWDELRLLWGIGTDSIASNSNLDLLEEVRFAINQQKIVYDYSILAKAAFEAITSKAAQIISKENEIGYLKNGFSADFLIYKIKNKSGCTYIDPYDLVISKVDNKTDLREVWINGKKAWIPKPILNRI